MLLPSKAKTQEVTPTTGASSGASTGSGVGGGIGAAIGSIFGPVGTAVGGAIGAGVGAGVGGGVGAAVDEGNTQTIQTGGGGGGQQGYDPLRESRALRDLYRTIGLSLEGYEGLDQDDPYAGQTEGLLYQSMARPEQTPGLDKDVQQAMVPDSIAFTPHDPLAFDLNMGGGGWSQAPQNMGY